MLRVMTLTDIYIFIANLFYQKPTFFQSTTHTHMARHSSVSSSSGGGGGKHHNYPTTSQSKRSQSAPPSSSRPSSFASQFKVPKVPPSSNNNAATSSSHPGVRSSNNNIGKSTGRHPTNIASSNNNNKIINEVKPKIQSTTTAPAPTTMLSRSINGRFQPRASSCSSGEQCYSDGMVSRGTFLPPPSPSSSSIYGAANYPSGYPGSRMT